MTWIRTIPYEQADGRLKTLYDRVKGPGDNVDNIMMAHSLRPHSMEGHMHIYKYVLHHSANRVPKSFLETLGVQVSLLNGCAYCVEHHFQGLRRLLDDDDRANSIRTAFEGGSLEEVFSTKELSAVRYTDALTRHSPFETPAVRLSARIPSFNRVSAANRGFRAVCGLAKHVMLKIWLQNAKIIAR